MTLSGRPVASVQDLEQELRRQAGALQAALAAEQQAAADQQDDYRRLQAEKAAVEADLQSARAELVAVREVLAAARRELQWLRRAGIDLNRLMDHPAARAFRVLGRGVRAVRAVGLRLRPR